MLTGAAFAGLVLSVGLSISTLRSRDLQATGQSSPRWSAGSSTPTSGVAVFGLGAVLVGLGAVVGWLTLPISMTSAAEHLEIARQRAERATISS